MGNKLRYIVTRESSLSHAVTISSGAVGNPTGPINGGQYSTKYYDPVARHERYLREKAAKRGTSSYTGSVKKLSTSSSNSTSTASSSGKSGGSGGSSGKGSSGSSSSKAMSKQLQKLREESSLNTAAQQEATKRKIEDLKAKLAEQIQKLQEDAYNKSQGEENLAELRGISQNLRSQIKSLQNKSSNEINQVGTQLQNWISTEKESLEKRIASLYSSYGQTYSYTTDADRKRASEKREKEVASRADAIYKKQSS